MKSRGRRRRASPTDAGGAHAAHCTMDALDFRIATSVSLSANPDALPVLNSNSGADARLAGGRRPPRSNRREVPPCAVVLVIACHAALFLFVLLASLALLRWNPPVTALMVYRGVTVHQKHRSPSGSFPCARSRAWRAAW